MRTRYALVESVGAAFARTVAASLTAPRAGRFSLFLSGGPTAREAYRELAVLTAPDAGATGAPGGQTVDWSTVDVFLGDERCVPPDDTDSNHRMITEELLEHVGPVGSDHPMYVSGRPDQAAAAYQRLVAPLHRIDLVHLGLGPDGHCASLVPGSTALAIDDPSVLVVADRDPTANNPHDRITLTLPAIARARQVVFTVSGTSKQGALARLVAGDDLPAARVRAEDVLWLVDAGAAGDTALPGGGGELLR